MLKFMLSSVGRPKNEAISIHDIILFHNFDLKNYLILKKNPYFTIEPYDLKGLQALINDNTCKTNIRVYWALYDRDFSSMVVSSNQLQINWIFSFTIIV